MDGRIYGSDPLPPLPGVTATFSCTSLQVSGSSRFPDMSFPTKDAVYIRIETTGNGSDRKFIVIFVNAESLTAFDVWRVGNIHAEFTVPSKSKLRSAKLVLSPNNRLMLFSCNQYAVSEMVEFAAKTGISIRIINEKEPDAEAQTEAAVPVCRDSDPTITTIYADGASRALSFDTLQRLLNRGMEISQQPLGVLHKCLIEDARKSGRSSPNVAVMWDSEMLELVFSGASSAKNSSRNPIDRQRFFHSPSKEEFWSYIDELRSKRVMRRLKPFVEYLNPETEYLLMPVLLKNHWVLAVCCRMGLAMKQASEMSPEYRPPCIYYFDSLANDANEENRDRIIPSNHLHTTTQICELFAAVAAVHYCNTYFLDLDFIPYRTLLDIPGQQPTSNDCGIFVVKFLEMILKEQITEDAANFTMKFHEEFPIKWREEKWIGIDSIREEYLDLLEKYCVNNVDLFKRVRENRGRVVKNEKKKK